MSLSAPERAALEAELATLEASRTAMISGQQVSEIASAGRTVKYSPANLTALMARIAQVKRLLGLSGGRVALRPFF